jgi:hypothetical protein
MLGCPGLVILGRCPPFAFALGPMHKKDKFTASVVLEGLHPQRVAVDIKNDHDVFVAKAGDLWKKSHLIGVHCLLKFEDVN